MFQTDDTWILTGLALVGCGLVYFGWRLAMWKVGRMWLARLQQLQARRGRGWPGGPGEYKVCSHSPYNQLKPGGRYRPLKGPCPECEKETKNARNANL